MLTAALVWSLFGWAWLAAVAAAAALAPLGVAAVARGQPVRPLALAQVGAAAVAGMLWLGAQAEALADPWLHLALAAGAGAAAAWAMRRAGVLADLGVILGLSALVPLLLAKLPHGRADLERIQWSSLLTASGVDAGVLGATAVLILAALLVWKRSIVAWIVDPQGAQAHGVACQRWDTGQALATGAVIGAALGAIGALATAGLVVLPAVIARCWCRSTASALIAAPLIAVGATAAGLLLSWTADVPPGQTVVGVLAGIACLAAGTRR
jgi:ABC-type Mn2+/Zn2+ transport system permease subunit